MREKHLSRHASCGASYVEAALAMPFVLLLITALIDVCRYGLALIVLHYAAFRAADLVSKTEVEADTRPFSCTQTPAQCERYLQVLRRAEAAAVAVASTTVNLVGESGMARLLPYTHYYADGQEHLAELAGASDELRLSIGVIRPGEKVRSPRGFEVQHARRPFDELGGPSVDGGYGWPNAGTEWAASFESNPIQVEILAEMEFFTPLLAPTAIRVRHSAWRRTGAFGVAVPPGKANPPQFNNVPPPPPPPDVVPDPGSGPLPAPPPPGECALVCGNVAACDLAFCSVNCGGCGLSIGD